jgi:hypothetical protein
MTDVGKQILNVNLPKDVGIEGAQDLIDAQLLNVTRRGFSLHIQYIDDNPRPGPVKQA